MHIVNSLPPHCGARLNIPFTLKFCDSPVICDNEKWLLLYFKRASCCGSFFSRVAAQEGSG